MCSYYTVLDSMEINTSYLSWVGFLKILFYLFKAFARYAQNKIYFLDRKIKYENLSLQDENNLVK